MTPCCIVAYLGEEIPFNLAQLKLELKFMRILLFKAVAKVSDRVPTHTLMFKKWYGKPQPIY
jgi:hypothetical protein